MSKQPPVQTLRHRYNGPKRGIGFSFQPICYNDPERTFPVLFLYEEDFHDMLPLIQQMYPLHDEQTGERYDSFDPCWDNPVGKPVWNVILPQFDSLSPDDPERQAFLHTFTRWARAMLEEADDIVVVGNL